MVALGPGVPVECERGAGGDVGVESAGGCALVAVDVVGGQGCGLDEAKVLVQRVPTCCLRPRVCGRVVPYWVRAFGPYSVGADAAYEAVGSYGVEKSGDGAEKECSGDHFVGRVGYK